VSCVRQCFSDHHGPHKPGEAKAVQVSWPPGPAGELGLTPCAELSIFSHILVSFVLTQEEQRPQRMETVARGLQLL